MAQAHRKTLTGDQQKMLDRALAQAIRKWDIDLVRAAVETGADPQPLIVNALQKKNLEILKLAVDQGADLQKLIQLGDNNYMSVLHVAHDNFNDGIILYLLEKGIRVDEKNFSDDTVAVRAMRAGDFEKMRFYIQHKADMSQNIQETLLAGVARKDLDVIKWSVDQGADVHALIKIRDNASIPLFHRAFENFREDIAQFFIAQGVSIDVRNSLGETVLMLAARAGDIKKVEFCLKNGADPVAQAFNGLSALDDVQKYIDGSGYREAPYGRDMMRLLLQEAKNGYQKEAKITIGLRHDTPVSKPLRSKPEEPGV